ncbi:MAG: TRAP transporter TatT component family protein [Pyrinomonadaceae bacterium]
MYLQTSCATPPSAEATPSGPARPPAAETISQAEKLFTECEDLSKLRQSVALLAVLRMPDARNFDVEWKFSKFSLFLGQRLTDETERTDVFQDGLKAGQIAARMEPDRPEGHFWYGANLGELSRMSPVTVGYKSIDDIRETMNKVVEIDPGYQGGSAFDVLGQLELHTRLFGGKSEKAVEYLEKALTFEKNNSNVRLHLAQAYLSAGKKDEAKRQLEYLVKMQPDPDFKLEHIPNLDIGKKLLASRF